MLIPEDLGQLLQEQSQKTNIPVDQLQELMLAAFIGRRLHLLMTSSLQASEKGDVIDPAALVDYLQDVRVSLEAVIQSKQLRFSIPNSTVTQLGQAYAMSSPQPWKEPTSCPH